eukprot:12072625-Alexandrium_andersonii.AAC.1
MRSLRIQRTMPPASAHNASDSAHNAEPPMKDSRARVARPPNSAFRIVDPPGLDGSLRVSSRARPLQPC